MADDESTGRFGLDEPVFGFMNDASNVPDANPNPPSTHSDSNAQSFYGSSWDFPVHPTSFDSFHVGSSANPPHVSTEPMAASWSLSAFNSTQRQRQPVTQLPESSTPFDTFSPPHVHPTSAFASTQRNASAASIAGQVRAAPALSHEELRNIAMPPHLQYNSPKSASSPDSANSEAKAGAASSPDLIGLSKKDVWKRKMPDELEDEDEAEEGDKPVKKTAHNMIEKRYRTNINDKIAALRDSVPSLRIMSKSARGEDTTEDREELHGLTPAHKLNKATVLSKATEYIRHLEKRNSRLLDENNAMKERIAAFEKLFMAGAMNGALSPIQQPPTPMQYPPDGQQQFSNSPMATPQESSPNPAGMINVPEDMKRIISAQMAGQPYPVPQQLFRGSSNPAIIRQQQIQQQQQQQPQMPQNGWVNASPYFGELMVGSLAGLMILESVRESEQSNDDPKGRGLFALPLQLLGRLSSALDLDVMGYHVHTSLKLVLFLGALMWVFVPWLFSPSGKKPTQQAAVPKRAPSLASPIHVRRQAWLTAIQTVWVPRHNFFLEASALILKACKLSLRNAIGVHGYQLLTGLTEEQETARVKAWSIALDSQLAGGDVDVCKSRLVLTLLASGTLPDTPARLMLKALHIRILLWDLNNGKWQLRAITTIAAKLARKRWTEARQLNRLLVRLQRGTAKQHEHELPDHLAALVEQECDEVLSLPVVQRAHNLAFNMETSHEIRSRVDDMDAVVDDTAIGSPMDSVAAWWSTHVLHRVLVATLDDDVPALQRRSRDIEQAFRVAPIGSLAQTRAALARAVFVGRCRSEDIDLARKAMAQAGVDDSMSSSSSSSSSDPPLVSVSPKLDQDVGVPLSCALALARLGDPDSSLDLDLSAALCRSDLVPSMTLLGFTFMMELMKQLLDREELGAAAESTLHHLASSLRLWMGRPYAAKCGVSSELRNKVVKKCLAATKLVAGRDIDTGYGSLSESEHDVG